MIEIACQAKKENIISEARYLFEKAISINPFYIQSYIEYSKMEEEIGKFEHCKVNFFINIKFINKKKILFLGLLKKPYSSHLLIKALRIEEKYGNLRYARSLLSRLKNLPIRKTWKVILEGASLETRNGRISVARKIYKV